MIRRPPRSTLFPTRRSSDLLVQEILRLGRQHRQAGREQRGTFGSVAQDRKSTRLNSSHLVISYAVFCLKKKKKSITTYNHSAYTSRRHVVYSLTRVSQHTCM